MNILFWGIVLIGSSALAAATVGILCRVFKTEHVKEQAIDEEASVVLLKTSALIENSSFFKNS